MLLKELRKHWFCNKLLQINTHMPKKSNVTNRAQFNCEKMKKTLQFIIYKLTCVQNMCNAPMSRFEG